MHDVGPRLVRVTLAGPDLAGCADVGLDQRVKILLPGPGADELARRAGLAAESVWRREWSALRDDVRPVMRSYTPVAVRPRDAEVDLDLYLHQPAGPASAWARRAAPGDRVLLSAPHARFGVTDHGTQWDPGPDVAHVLLVGDETSAPAVRGILASLRPDVRVHVLVEAGDPADAPVGDVRGTVRVAHVPRQHRGRERAVLGAVRAWAAEHGRSAADAGSGFYAWCATESATVARVRAELVAAGIARSRVHAQGYWHDRARPGPERDVDAPRA
ncbi:siderophore-interacting protein [Cellulosimicrobium cellulans]|uniref:siderophore-interacting protein n=1 Tax=Cellulosimicrobium cellulans TaxID=1710 RepID=UPI001965D32C|nr:siderophore-interacting protein [Cellulosimicrobium cellulans]